MIKSRLSILVNIAMSDGEMPRSEMNLIKELGERAGLSDSEIKEIISNPMQLEEMTFWNDIGDNDRFEFMYNIYLLMKADGKLVKEEINYCLQVAKLLGYRESVLFEFITAVQSDDSVSFSKPEVKDKVQKYLREKS